MLYGFFLMIGIETEGENKPVEKRSGFKEQRIR